jgi:hypothetical protein
MSSLGYTSRRYSESFQDVGEVIALPKSGIRVLKRPIDEKHYDFVGLYPFTVSGDWYSLDADLEFMRGLGAVSIVLVVDPSPSNWQGRPFHTGPSVNVSRRNFSWI